jgi:UDPglucose--hexose-1-phosphate uridylyltransferase
LWTERTRQLAENPEIAFVAPFENCGAAVGVTMPHPHGQIYAMPFVPPNIQKEISSAKEFANANGGECLFCRLLREELNDGSRVVTADDQFVAFVPYAARFPAEVMLHPRRHIRTLLDLSVEERSSLANLLSITRRKYDHLYGFVMPLMMAVKQAPLREPEAPYHFHVQFMPLQRSPTKLKYLATMETGFGTFLADTAPEKMAESLRKSEPATSL